MDNFNMKKLIIERRFCAIVLVVFFISFARIIPHPPNFTPVLAVGLFAGAFLQSRHSAILLVFASMFFSDLFLGFHSTFFFTYFSLFLCVMIGGFLKNNTKLLPVFGATIASSFLFYLITNFGVWMVYSIYPNTFSGLLQSYIAGIPFFGNSLAGNFFYVGIVFGGFSLIEKRFFKLA